MIENFQRRKIKTNGPKNKKEKKNTVKKNQNKNLKSSTTQIGPFKSRKKPTASTLAKEHDLQAGKIGAFISYRLIDSHQSFGKKPPLPVPKAKNQGKNLSCEKCLEFATDKYDSRSFVNNISENVECR